jgi:predicted patatin/cPLA2 family phospholipase
MSQIRIITQPESVAGEHLHGTNPEAVISAIKTRYFNRQSGNDAADGRKLALIFEGGAMRGAASAGGAVALEHLGFSAIFDEIYATSAGVMNASYFLASQTNMGITIYFEDLTTGRFIKPMRFWKLVDVDYLIDEVATFRKPLDVQRVLKSPTRLFVVVMDKATGEASLVDTKNSTIPLLNIIKAALALPVLYNRTVELEGKHCMDGGLRIPFPLQQAIDNGCTDILLLLSRSYEYVARGPSWLERCIFNLVCARGRRGLRAAFASHHLTSRAARDVALGRSPANQSSINIAAICTERSDAIQRTTVDPATLRAAAISYGRRTLRAFGVEPGNWQLGPASDVHLSRGT